MLNVRRSIAFWILAVALLLIVQASNSSSATARQRRPQSNAVAQKPNAQLIHSLEGVDLYHAYCAACHGPEAHGNGPAAPALRTKPPDLTLIAKRHGGAFPADRVTAIISGETSPMAHGSREMPIWGPVFHQVEADQDWGNVRLKNLTKYLESIQNK
jgi:mono/diheme cytochrome c family protein